MFTPSGRSGRTDGAFIKGIGSQTADKSKAFYCVGSLSETSKPHDLQGSSSKRILRTSARLKSKLSELQLSACKPQVQR